MPHPEWRLGQHEAYEWLVGLKRGTVAIVQSATGSGKSTWPAAIGNDYVTIVLTETKALQSQYHNFVHTDTM